MGKVMKTVPLVILCALIIAASAARGSWPANGTAICAAIGDQQTPQIISDGAGGAIITWQDNRNGNLDIFVQRVNAWGFVLWTTNGLAVCTAAGEQYSPMIASDGEGGAIVTWHDFRNPLAPDIYAQRVDASGAVQWTANGVAVCTATDAQVFPVIAADGAGGAIITWRDNRGGVFGIYAQKVNAAGLAQWTTDGVALCRADGDQDSPMIIEDGSGGAIVTWAGYRSESYDIYAARVSASGVALWTPNGVSLCVGTGAYPRITADGAGGAIVAWQDCRAFAWDIYGQRINSAGAVQWPVNGIAICAAPDDQVYPAVASDGAGGAIVTWPDYYRYDLSGLDIYAQRVSAVGTLQWPMEGVELCTAPEEQSNPVITADGAGGAIVAWCDLRFSDSYNIYAQRVNAAGSVQWTVDGVALCAATNIQSEPVIVSDGSGGALATWSDYRNGESTDIYAQRVNANGSTTGANVPGVSITLGQNYPNPFNPLTTVTYSISEKCNVTLTICDVSGTCIRRLLDGEQEKGSYRVEWNGRDDMGRPVASGVFFCRLAAGNETISRKMILLR
jgi:hypothetical protein